MKQMKLRILLLLAVLLCLCGGCRKTAASYYAYTGNVNVSIGLGYEGIVEEGYPFPVMVHVEGEYASQGKWCVLTVPTNEEDYYSYRVEMDSSDHQDICYAIPVAQGSSQLVVELLDEEQKVIYSRTCTYRAQSDWQMMILSGRMGAQTDSIAWPQSIETENSFLTHKSIILNGHSMFTEEQAYQLLDFLVTDAETIRSLSQEVQDALAGWVSRGGCLVVERAAETELFSGMQLRAQEEKIYPVNETIRIPFYLYGNGMVWTVEQPLSQLMPRLTDYQKEQLLLALAEGDSGLYAAVLRTPMESRERQLTQILAGEQIIAQAPNVWVYFALLMVYLVIAIPAIYLILLRKKLVGWFRPAVCLLAFLVSGLIFAAGSRTRFSEPFLRCLTILREEEDGFRELDYVRLQAPFNTQYEVDIRPEYQVRTVMDYPDWKQDNNVSYRKHTAELVQLADRTQIVISNLIAFSSRYFCLEQCDITLQEIGNGVTAVMDENGQNGETAQLAEMTNQTDFVLKSAVVVQGEQLYLVENWQPGETLDWLEENSRIHLLSRRQFLEGGFKNRGSWKGRLSDYYINLIDDMEEDGLYVMAEVSYEPLLQCDGGYGAEYDSILLLKPLTQ